MNMIDLLSSLPGAVAQGLIWGIMAVGVYITYKLLDIADLTVDGSICTGAAVCTMMLLSGRSLWLAMLCAVAAGLLAGVVTGLLHIWLGIPPILAGILTQMTLWSVNLKIMGKANQGLSVRDNHVLLSQMDVPGALVVLAIAAVLVVAVLYLFFGTELGCGIRATGCNPVMSRAQGINTDLSKVIGLSLSNGLVALSGALLCQYQGYADINMGRGAVVIGLAAVVIGEAVVKHISPNFAVRLTGGRRYLLSGVSGHHLRGLRHRSAENVLGAGGGRLFGRAVCEEAVGPEAPCQRRDPSCLKCAM